MAVLRDPPELAADHVSPSVLAGCVKNAETTGCCGRSQYLPVLHAESSCLGVASNIQRLVVTLGARRQGAPWDTFLAAAYPWHLRRIPSAEFIVNYHARTHIYESETLQSQQYWVKLGVLLNTTRNWHFAPLYPPVFGATRVGMVLTRSTKQNARNKAINTNTTNNLHRKQQQQATKSTIMDKNQTK